MVRIGVDLQPMLRRCHL